MNLRSFAWFPGFLLLSGCQSDGTAQRFVDSCVDVPESCGAVYSQDGKFMAFLSPSGAGNATQVYRARADVANSTPELISMNGDGEPADGSCHELSFLADDSLIFRCEATNLVPGTSGLRYVKQGDAPVSVYTGG